MDMFVAAALEIFHELGYDHGRLEDIAKRAGVSKTAVYNHFASKYALLVATIERVCLPVLPDPPHQPEIGLERALATGVPGRVLDIVLAERRSLPQLGPLYYEASVRRLLQWPNVTTREQAEAMLQKALKAASFERLFRAPAVPAALG
jgi:AcrR family transcriptional regulator